MIIFVDFLDRNQKLLSLLMRSWRKGHREKCPFPGSTTWSWQGWATRTSWSFHKHLSPSNKVSVVLVMKIALFYWYMITIITLSLWKLPYINCKYYTCCIIFLVYNHYYHCKNYIILTVNMLHYSCKDNLRCVIFDCNFQRHPFLWQNLAQGQWMW